MKTYTKTIRGAVVCVGAAAAMLSGCGAEQATAIDAGDGGTTRTGMALTVDIKADTDIAGMRYIIDGVACPGEQLDAPSHQEFETDLEDLALPGMIPEFEENPLDPGSSHLFADQFVVLPEGCYQVAVQPLTGAGEPSEDCAPAQRDLVEVNDGLTTEVTLVSQCGGEGTGGLDTAAIVNHPPTVIALTYEPSKFTFECERVTLCATANDPDGDPIEFVWEQLAGHALYEAPTPVSHSQDGDDVTECVELTPRFTGNAELKVTVYDTFQDGQDTVRVEDWLAEQGYPGDSSDDLTMPLYTNWDIEFACYDPATQTYTPYEGVRAIQRAPGCDYTTPAEFYCNPNYADPAVHCPGGEFDPTTVYDLCD